MLVSVGISLLQKSSFLAVVLVWVESAHMCGQTDRSFQRAEKKLAL